MIYEFEGIKPVIHPSAFIHPQASVIGDIFIGKDVYVGASAVIRGDWGKIRIEDGSNVQENCTLHLFPGATVWLRQGAHIGHGAVVHGAEIGENCLIGMNAVVMDGVIVGKESIVGALAFVKGEMKIPERSLVAGHPAKIIRKVSEEQIGWKTQGTKLYQQLPKACQETLRECTPLREADAHRKGRTVDFKTWKETKRKNNP